MARSFAFFSAYSFLWKTDPNQATSSADEYWLAIIIGHSHTFYQRSSFRNLSFFECESYISSLQVSFTGSLEQGHYFPIL